MGDDIGDDAPGLLRVLAALLISRRRAAPRLVEIDRNCKQGWFREAFPEFGARRCRAPGGKTNGE